MANGQRGVHNNNKYRWCGVADYSTRLFYYYYFCFLLYYTPCGLYNEQEGGFGERHGRGTTHQCCFETAPANNNANGAWGDHRQRKTTSSSSCVVQSCNKENGLLCVYNIHGDANTTVCPPLVGRPGKFITANSEAVSVIRRVVQCKGNQSRSPINILLVVVHSGPVSLGYIYEGVFAELTYSVRRNVGTSSSFTHRSDPPDPWRGIIRVYWIFSGRWVDVDGRAFGAGD